jgi:probable rRNA maturation factor
MGSQNREGEFTGGSPDGPSSFTCAKSSVKDADVVILRKNVAGLSENALNRFVKRAAASAGVRGEVNVLLTSNSELQSLNRRFRGKDYATDVLAFPAGDVVQRKIAGDIAISADIAAFNGVKLGHSVAEEVKILVLHGVLHLAGYDHERDNGAMARNEALLRRALKLPIGLIARQSAATVKDGTPKRSRGMKR